MTDKIKLPYDLSLRLTSLSVPLAKMGQALGAPISHLHVMGEPIAVTGRFAGRLASQHYLNTEWLETDNEGAIFRWVENVAGNISKNEFIEDHLIRGSIHGELWVVRLRPSKNPEMPKFHPELIDKVSRAGLKIFIEDYTNFGSDGLPLRAWLP